MATPAAQKKMKERPKPFLMPEYCKGCGRCISACPKDCIEFEDSVNPESGLLPVHVNMEICNGCGLCILACPEPFGLHAGDVHYEWELFDPEKEFGEKGTTATTPEPIPPERIPLPKTEPILIKGTFGAAIGALLAGCRHFFGYPITPSTEGAELMAKVLPHLDGVFVQAVSEVATVNHMYGCGGSGLPCMTFTSSPGFSLMLEGISYMMGAEVPGVFVNVMRGGPGLGNIGPAQADIKLACRGLGHGDTHALVLAPADPQEMLDLTMQAFELTFKYRHPVVILADGDLGQVTGKVQLPDHMIRPGVPEWAVWGDEAHRGNLINSIRLDHDDQEQFNHKMFEKFRRMERDEQRSELFRCDDAEVLFIASNAPSRTVKGAIPRMRREGLEAGLFRPISLWPFPVNDLVPLLDRAKRLIVVEASDGQLEDEVRLALSHAGVTDLPPIDNVRRYGGNLPQASEILDVAGLGQEVRA
jgi:pyruvate/2-oxoacid:ferredoxin oxidoreductase alpha subunit/NAD-dependent dihydropyrimidine dehydrogenase PreA subunit